MTVYFIRVDKRVKIGFSHDVEKRLKGLKTACPSPPVLLGVIDGNRNTEAKIHAKLARHRATGEWFYYCDEVRFQIEALINQGALDGDDIGDDADNRPARENFEEIDTLWENHRYASKIAANEHLSRARDEIRLAMDFIDSISILMPPAQGRAALSELQFSTQMLMRGVDTAPVEHLDEHFELLFEMVRNTRERMINAIINMGPVVLFRPEHVTAIHEVLRSDRAVADRDLETIEKVFRAVA